MRDPENTRGRARNGARDGQHDDMSASAGALSRWVPDTTDDSPRRRRLLRLGTSDGVRSELTRKFDRRDPLVIYRGGSWRLSPDGSLRRWDASVQRWESIRKDSWSRDEAVFVDEPTNGAAPAPEESGRDDAWASVEGCTFVGGTLEDLCVYGKYKIVFGHDAVTMLSRQAGVVEIPCDEIVAVEIGGRGRVEPGDTGRESFGFERGVDDMAATSVVRSLVARAEIDTSIRIETRTGEAYFHCDCATPDELRLPLAPFLMQVRQRRSDDGKSRVDPARQLVQLADLKTRGLLTDEEFGSATAAVLRGDF